MKTILEVLGEWRDTYFSEFWYGYNALSDETGIPIKELKKQIKTLAKNGMVVHKPTYDLDTGLVNGSGWFLKDEWEENE